MGSRTEPVNDEVWPLVSVIIPTYGRNEFLLDAVESVAEQTYDPIELIIVDDGSPIPIADTLTDAPLERLDSTTFIRHHTNRGANAARNSGIRSASGEYLAFLDDDDLWHPTKISRQVKAFLTAPPEVGVVYTGKQAEGPGGTTVMTPSVEGDVVEELVTGTNFGQFSSVMVRADLIEAAGLPDERLPAWQDREWFFRLAQQCHFKAVPEILTFRRTGLSGNITGNFEAKRDVAYPLFVEKHYSLARDCGYYQARTFLASLRRALARSAIHAGEYREARKYFLLAFLANPFYRPVHAHLLASLGGRWTYDSATFLRQKAISIRSAIG